MLRNQVEDTASNRMSSSICGEGTNGLKLTKPYVYRYLFRGHSGVLYFQPYVLPLVSLKGCLLIDNSIAALPVS